jgi:hypothetical protein
MSGGHFDYRQSHITDIADSIEEIIKGNDTPDEYGHKTGYSEKTIAELKNAISILRKAFIYAHRVDWLRSSDDDEKTFHEMLAEGLGRL